MSTDVATAPVADSHGEAHDHHGPSDLDFIKTAAVLAAITALEVLWSYLHWPEHKGVMWTIAEIAPLLLMMAFKFWIVAGVFMHLKFDKKLLTGVFYAGLVLAVCVYLAVLLTFQVFVDHAPGFAP